MKETQIAEENVEGLRDDNRFYQTELARCVEHLASCQRFLEFLENYGFTDISHNSKLDLLEDKKKDLQTVIKVYEDGGVR